MEATGVTLYLWSPWRCSALEHRLFESVKAVPGVEFEAAEDEGRLNISDPKVWRTANQTMERVLKGWQEDAVEGGSERRGWRWLLEADTDTNGYDTQNERSCFWCFVRLSLDRGGPGEPEKGEDLDLNGFGVSVWREE
jgi:hypothetical protein